MNLAEIFGGTEYKDRVFYNNKRLQVIEEALKSMKIMNHQFLKKYEQTENWQRINSGLIRHNKQTNLQNLVDFKICESNKTDKTYFNPYSKKPITVCYNKFIDQEPFDEALTYNLILYYDHKTQNNMNWNDLKDTVLVNVRALNISNICNAGNNECIQKELKERVFEKERFKGKELNNLSQIIEKGLNDMTPISQIIVKNDV